MNREVATRTEGDHIFFCIRSRLTAKLLMVYFQIRHRAAGLTTPAVTA